LPGTQNLARHFVKTRFGNRLRGVCIGIEEDRVFGASVSSEFLPELSKLFLDRSLGFSVQRNSFRFVAIRPLQAIDGERTFTFPDLQPYRLLQESIFISPRSSGFLPGQCP